MITMFAKQRPSAIIAAVLLGCLAGTPAQSRAITDTWPVLGSDRDGDCRLEILGNSKLMVINITGLKPGSRAHFGVTNATMKPIDWQVKANASGAWQLIFLPLHYNKYDGTARDYQEKGVVGVSLSSADCKVSTSAQWTREIRVIP
ncbi:hypothetical protein [Novosphingobium sp.]|uniref:hypothetical protein n=1 Tax=Novosphingobium sp. TaxID=1874826 RepID=UPI0035AEB5FB